MKKLLSVLFLIIASFANAQDRTSNPLGFSIGAQLYPAGIIPHLQLLLPMRDHLALNFRFGYNSADRKDFSPHNEHEEGGGFGTTIGLRRYFTLRKGFAFGGLNSDIWNLTINWSDTKAGEKTTGSTDILVLQPWLEAGYLLPISNSNFDIGTSLGFGREINLITIGDEVAQGWMGSLSLFIKVRF
ncbi:MAG: hypothetical protein ACKVOR_00530 [Flavobacteriales bacterium]